MCLAFIFAAILCLNTLASRLSSDCFVLLKKWSFDINVHLTFYNNASCFVDFLMTHTVYQRMCFRSLIVKPRYYCLSRWKDFLFPKYNILQNLKLWWEKKALLASHILCASKIRTSASNCAIGYWLFILKRM